jgi:hypothetical protein
MNPPPFPVVELLRAWYRDALQGPLLNDDIVIGWLEATIADPTVCTAEQWASYCSLARQLLAVERKL